MGMGCFEKGFIAKGLRLISGLGSNDISTVESVPCTCTSVLKTGRKATGIEQESCVAAK